MLYNSTRYNSPASVAQWIEHPPRNRAGSRVDTSKNENRQNTKPLVCGSLHAGSVGLIPAVAA